MTINPIVTFYNVRQFWIQDDQLITEGNQEIKFYNNSTSLKFDSFYPTIKRISNDEIFILDYPFFLKVYKKISKSSISSNVNMVFS